MVSRCLLRIVGSLTSRMPRYVLPGIRDVRDAAVDGHGVAARGEARAELLGARLEAAVAGGHAAGPEQGDAQRGSPGMSPLSHNLGVCLSQLRPARYREAAASR